MTEVLPALSSAVRPQTPSNELATPGPLAVTYTGTTSAAPSLNNTDSRSSLNAPRSAEPSCPPSQVVHRSTVSTDVADGTQSSTDEATGGAGGGNCQIFSSNLEHTAKESVVGGRDGGVELRPRQSCAGQPVVRQWANSPNAVHARRGGGGNARGPSTTQALRAPSMPLAELRKARSPSPAHLATQSQSHSPRAAKTVVLSERQALSSPRRGSHEAAAVATTTATTSPNYYMALLHTALHERRRRFAPATTPTRPPASTEAQGAGSQEEIIRGFMDSLVAKHAHTVPAWSTRVRTAELYRDRPVRLRGDGADLAEARPADRNFLERARQGMQEYMTQLTDAMELLQRAEDSAGSEQLQYDAEKTLLRRYEDGSGSPKTSVTAETEWRLYCHRQCRVLRDMADEVRTVWRRLERVLAVHARNDPYLPVNAAQDRRSSSARKPSRSRSARASLSAAHHDSPRHTASLLSPPRYSVVGDLVGGLAAADWTEDKTTHNNDPAAVGTGAERGRSTSYSRYACPAEVGGTTSVQRGSPAIHPGHLSPSVVGQKNGVTRQVAAAAATTAAERSEETRLDDGDVGVMGQLNASGVPPSPGQPSASPSYGRPPMLDMDVLGLEAKTQPTLVESRALSPYMRCLVHVNYTPRRSSARRASVDEDTLRDPAAPPAIVLTPRNDTGNALDASDNAVVARSVGDKPSHMAMVTIGDESRLVARPPELHTYRSPRGRIEVAAPLPLLSPERRMELLRVIVQFERDYTNLQRDNLHRARECFQELYGTQRGLVQYCDWIDGLALKALRRCGTP